MLLPPLFTQLLASIELCLQKLCVSELVVFGDDGPACSEPGIGRVEEFYLVMAERQVFVKLHVLDGVVQLLGVAAEVLYPVLYLVLGPVGEVYLLQLAHLSLGNRYYDLQQPVFELGKLGLCLQPFFDQGSEEGTEEGDVVLEDVDPFLPGHHHRVVAEKFFLGSPAVDIEEEGVLVEGYLRGHAQDQVSFGERPAVYFILGESSLNTAAKQIFEL